MRLYYERGLHRGGAIGAADEEDCFTTRGRRCGLWLTTEQITGPTVVSTVVRASDVDGYEVTGEDSSHRVFVVPALLAGTWTFS